MSPLFGEYYPFLNGVKNPKGGEKVVLRSPQEIMDEIAMLDAESSKVPENISVLL